MTRRTFTMLGSGSGTPARFRELNESALRRSFKPLPGGVSTGVRVFGCFGCTPPKSIPYSYIGDVTGSIAFTIPGTGTEVNTDTNVGPFETDEQVYTQTWELPPVINTMAMELLGGSECGCGWVAHSGVFKHSYSQTGPGTRFGDNSTRCALFSQSAYPATTTLVGDSPALKSDICSYPPVWSGSHPHTNCNGTVTNPHNGFTVTELCYSNFFGTSMAFGVVGTGEVSNPFKWSYSVNVSSYRTASIYEYLTGNTCPGGQFSDLRLSNSYSVPGALSLSDHGKPELVQSTIATYEKEIDCDNDFDGNPIVLTRVTDEYRGFARFPLNATVTPV